MFVEGVPRHVTSKLVTPECERPSQTRHCHRSEIRRGRHAATPPDSIEAASARRRCLVSRLAARSPVKVEDSQAWKVACHLFYLSQQRTGLTSGDFITADFYLEKKGATPKKTFRPDFSRSMASGHEDQSGPTAQESSVGPYCLADARRSPGVACYGKIGTSAVEVGSSKAEVGGMAIDGRRAAADAWGGRLLPWFGSSNLSSERKGSKLEHRGQRLTMMPETAILPAKRGDVGSVGVHPCVVGGCIRQYTASDGAPMVYGVEAALAVEGRIRLECEADDHVKRWKGWPFLWRRLGRPSGRVIQESVGALRRPGRPASYNRLAEQQRSRGRERYGLTVKDRSCIDHSRDAYDNDTTLEGQSRLVGADRRRLT
ncbi:hypothetical protein THAOC_14110 [Thalassiosira oceanica]|uniref:Uncharacterized protein n=1 Tax=Thalassiosira oceanica TaxID=159749 RepID=K0SJG4_THAOC|nr:hypothetical protein THAOC_14110 [Thalassiosira oceanica]|eukprot:EJK65084.1 hypothetical protein THAOC_14110 [Thalassiosira oceanica]